MRTELRFCFPTGLVPDSNYRRIIERPKTGYRRSDGTRRASAPAPGTGMLRACVAGLTAVLIATAAMAAVATAAVGHGRRRRGRRRGERRRGPPSSTRPATRATPATPATPARPSDSPAPTDPPASPSPEPSESEREPVADPERTAPPPTPPPSTTPPVRPVHDPPARPARPRRARPAPGSGAYVTTGDIRSARPTGTRPSTATDAAGRRSPTPARPRAVHAALHAAGRGDRRRHDGLRPRRRAARYRVRRLDRRAGAGWSTCGSRYGSPATPGERMPLMRLGAGHRGRRRAWLGTVQRQPGLRRALPARPAGRRDQPGRHRGQLRVADRPPTSQVKLRNTGVGHGDRRDRGGAARRRERGGASRPAARRPRADPLRRSAGSARRKIRQVTLPLIATPEAQRPPRSPAPCSAR